MRYKSERLRDEAEKLIKSRENKTVHTQQASNQKLNNRLHDVVLFRSELEVILLSIYDFFLLVCYYNATLLYIGNQNNTFSILLSSRTKSIGINGKPLT